MFSQDDQPGWSGFRSQMCRLLAVCSWASDLSTLCPSCLNRRLRIISISHHGRSQWGSKRLLYVKCWGQPKAHHKHFLSAGYICHFPGVPVLSLKLHCRLFGTNDLQILVLTQPLFVFIQMYANSSMAVPGQKHWLSCVSFFYFFFLN